MPRPFRLFREYDFFGVLLPGLAAVVFLYMLLPVDITVGLPSGIVFVSVFGFVFGQGLHSVSLFVEGLPNTLSRMVTPPWSHRQRFKRELNNPTHTDKETVARLRREATAACPGVDYRSEFGEKVYNQTEATTLYVFVRSYLHAKDHTRSSGIKAMYAFCRNMLVLLAGLIPLYLSYGLFSTKASLGPDWLAVVDRAGKYTLYFPDYGEFLKGAVPLALIGTIIFFIGTFICQRFYVQYLISDFLAVRRIERDDNLVYR